MNVFMKMHLQMVLDKNDKLSVSVRVLKPSKYTHKQVGQSQ